MKHRIARCAALAALALAAATSAVVTSAQAQVYGGSPYGGPPGAYEPSPDAEPMVRPMFGPRLPPSEVLTIVRASGLRPLTQPASRGSHYVLLASDNMGGQLRVVVNGNNGRIVNAAPAYDPRFAYHPVRPRGLVPGAPAEHDGAPHGTPNGAPAPRYSSAAPPSRYGAAPPSDLNEPSPPLPSTSRPNTARTTPPSQGSSPAPKNSRLASAPDNAAPAAPVRPKTTPLPRPRPAIASNETTPPTAAAPAPQAPPETSPEAEPPAAAPAPAAPEAPAAKPTPPTETQMVPVAPLD